MVKLYLKDESHIDVKFWSLVKAYVIGWIGTIIISLGIFFILFIFLYFLG